MMTRVEHLLTILAEECAEIAQRCSKAIRFGLAEVQAGQAKTNVDRLIRELNDVMAVVGMLVATGVLPDEWEDGAQQLTKTRRVERWLRYSAERGTLSWGEAASSSLGAAAHDVHEFPPCPPETPVGDMGFRAEEVVRLNRYGVDRAREQDGRPAFDFWRIGRPD